MNRSCAMLQRMHGGLACQRHRTYWFATALVALMAGLFFSRPGTPTVSDPTWWLGEAKTSVQQIRNQNERAVLSDILFGCAADVYSTMAVADAKAVGPLAAAKRFGDAIDAVRYIKDPALQKHAYLAIARNQVRADDLSGAKTTVMQIESSLQVEGYMAIALTQLEIGDTAGAVASAGHSAIRGPLAHDVYLAIAIAQASGGDDESAQRHLDEAIGAFPRAGWAALDAWSTMESRCAVAGAQVHCGELDRALRTASRAEVPHVAFVKARACAAMACAHAVAGDATGAAGAFKQAIDLVARFEPSSAEVGRLKEKTAALLDIAWAQRTAGDNAESESTTRLAVETLSSITDLSARDRILGELVSDRIICGDLGGAATCASAIESEQDRAAATNRVPTSATSELNSHLLAMAPQGSVGAHYSAMFAAIASNDLLVAQSHVNRIESEVAVAARVHVLCETICHLGKSGDFQQVQGLIDRTSTDVSMIETPMKRRNAQLQLIGALAAVGRFDQAFGFVSQIDEATQKELALAHIAISQADDGRIDDAITTTGLIKSEDMPLARAWQAIATAQANAGFGGAARGSFTAAVKASQGSVDSESRMLWLHEVVRARIECGDFEGALQDARPYWGKPRIVEYFQTIGCTAVQSGKVPQLLELLRLTDDPVEKAALQLGAAAGTAKVGTVAAATVRP